MCLKPLDALSIHTRGPVIGPNFLPGRLQCRWCKHLVHQTIPTSSFDAVDQRQHHTLRPYASFHPIIVCVLEDFSALCSPCGHFRRCLCFRIGHRVSTFLPPLPRHGFATHAFRRVHNPARTPRHRYYEGSESCRTSPVRQASPVHLSCLPSIQPPNTLRSCTSRFLITPVRTIGSLRFQASPYLCRLAATPRRNGFALLQAARSRSSCSPPRLE